MSERMRGRIAFDEVGPDGHFKGLVGYRVELVFDEDDLYGGRTVLGSTKTKDFGLYELTYGRDRSQVGHHRRLEILVRDVAGRIVLFRQVHPDSTRFVVDKGRIRFPDVDDEQIVAQDFVVFAIESTGFAVTRGTAQVVETHGPGEGVPMTAASGHGLSNSNAVHVLTDKDVFVHTAQLLRAAQTQLLLSQYNFTLPPQFHALPTDEETKVIVDFKAPIPRAATPRQATVDDARPERLLVLAADKGVDVRMVFHAFKLPLWLKIVLGIFVFPFAGSDGVFELSGPLSYKSAFDEAKLYFGIANRPNLRLRAFQMLLTQYAVMHARLLAIDGLEAMCFGASFGQSYVDIQDHAVDAPIRGAATGMPLHDLGIRVKGPAVGDIHENLRLLWNNAGTGERLDTLDRNPPLQSSGGDGLCSIQVVRTVPPEHFGEPGDPIRGGETGVLEGYQRAIAMADILLYIENQYFTDGRIADAIVNAMLERPQLQVLMVLNVTPDIWYFLYPRRQRKLITRIRRKIGENPDDPARFAVFTRWTHDTSQPRPRILPIYIHSKAAVVDDRWATVGSANLDHASMDRAFEVNANLISAGGDPATSIPDILRRKLWAEHLGFFKGPTADEPDPDAPDLLAIPVDGWVGLWKRRAKQLHDHLKAQPSQPSTGMARVLPWPSKDETFKTPREYLKAIGIDPHRVLPLKGTRPFDFKTGLYAPGSKPSVDS